MIKTNYSKIKINKYNVYQMNLCRQMKIILNLEIGQNIQYRVVISEIDNIEKIN